MINDAMKKVIEAGNTKCGQSGNCIFCEYNQFCEALKSAYKLANVYYKPDLTKGTEDNG